MNAIINILINYGLLGIAAAGFSEAIFLPMPMEFVFIPIALVSPSKAFIYSLILIFFSALGSTAGYYIGSLVGMPLMNRFISKDRFDKLNEIYSKNSFLAILTSSFTPIPYEVYVISAGIFKVDFAKFILASLISRVVRYLPQGIIISLYGAALLPYIKRYVIIIALVVFVVILIFKYLFNRNEPSNSQEK